MISSKINSLKDPNLESMDEGQLRQWFEARNTFLGIDDYNQDVGKGLELASKCNHPDARWLCSVIPDPNMSALEAYELLSHLAQSANDGGRTQTFAALVDPLPSPAFQHSSRYPLALAYSDFADSVDLIEAAEAYEPDALCQIAKFHGHYNWEKMELAARLGHFEAQYKVLKYRYKDWDPERYIKFDVLARKRIYDQSIVKLMYKCIREFQYGSYQHGAATFTIGKLVEDVFDLSCRDECLIYGDPLWWAFDNLQKDVNAASKAFAIAITLYRDQTRLTKDGIRMWSLIGKRLKVVKDIRIMISKMIWADRSNVSNVHIGKLNGGC